jgi:hypothetical protein
MRFEPIESALLRVEHDLYHPRHGAYAERRRTDPADASPWRTRGCDDEWYGSLHGPVDLVDDLAGDDDEDSPALVVRGARERWRAGRIDENGRYELLEDGGNALGLTGVPDAGAVTDIERAAVDSEDAIHVRVRDARRRARRTQRGRASLQITCAYGGATRRFERATWDAVERDAVEWFHAQDGELVEAA